MKKNLCLLVALSVFGYTKAQLKEKGSIEITPKIGISSFSEYVTTSSVNDGFSTGSTDEITSVSIGSTIDYYFNNRWSLRSGFTIEQMGGKYYLNGRVFKDKLNYLSIPIQANWHFGANRNWNLNVGLSPSFLTSAKVNNETIPKEILEPIQLGLSFGIGYKFEITKNFGILLDTQFFNGLSNLNKEENLPGSYKNVGYSFNIGGVLEL